MSTLDKLRNMRRSIIYNNALAKKQIRPFDEATYDNLRKIIYSVLPAIIYIKFERPLTPPGNCMERAYLLSTAIEGSNVVFGHHSDIGTHFWVEKGMNCYDPTSLMEYDKDVYYKLNGIKNAEVITDDELKSLGVIKYCHRRKIEDFDTDPSYCKNLSTILPFVQERVLYSGNPEYKKELDDYLDRLGYYQKRDKLLKQSNFNSGRFMI